MTDVARSDRRETGTTGASSGVKVEPLVAPRGLKGVVVTDTEIGDVRGLEGFFHYREYPAPELARHQSLEEVWFLLVNGRLPNATEIDGFRDSIALHRHASPETAAVISSAAVASPRPMDLLRTALSCQAGDGSWLDTTRDERLRTANALAAVLPTLAATAWCAIDGRDAPSPDSGRPIVTDYLRMVTGREPAQQHVAALERYMLLTIDHGLNASTFTCRGVTSTGASFGSAAVAALGALSGPLHGGAPSLVRDMLREIETPERARAWIRDTIGRGDKLMGFGHAVYRTEDPRSALLKETGLDLGGPLAELAAAVEPIALEEMERHRPGADLRTNVEFYAAVVLDAVGLPPEMFTPTFAVSRMIGWMAHALEQADDNKIIRPSSRYVGPPPPSEFPVSAL